MKNIGYYNGKTGPLEEMTIPMLDRSVCFGDGVYDASFSRNGIIYMLDEHIDRFYSSAAKVDIKIDMLKPELAGLLKSLLKQVEPDDEYLVYWQASRGTAMRAHSYPDDMKANLMVMISPHRYNPCIEPVKLITREDTRHHHCDIKTINLLPNVIAAKQVQNNDCFEVVFHRGDRVTECSHSNVHILRTGEFITAPADNLILPGITRAGLIKACEKLGIPVHERPFTVDEMFAADEVLVTSSSVQCIRACEIDNKPVGGGATELYEKLRDYMMDRLNEATAAVNE